MIALNSMVQLKAPGRFGSPAAAFKAYRGVLVEVSGADVHGNPLAWVRWSHQPDRLGYCSLSDLKSAETGR